MYYTYICLDRLYIIDFDHIPNWCTIGLISMNAMQYILKGCFFKILN